MKTQTISFILVLAVTSSIGLAFEAGTFESFYCSGKTLDDWIDCAKKFRPEVSANESRLEAARNDIAAEWSSFLPKVDVTMSKTNQFATITSGERKIEVNGINRSQNITFHVPLFDGGVRYSRLKLPNKHLWALRLK